MRSSIDLVFKLVRVKDWKFLYKKNCFGVNPAVGLEISVIPIVFATKKEVNRN